MDLKPYDVGGVTAQRAGRGTVAHRLCLFQMRVRQGQLHRRHHAIFRHAANSCVPVQKTGMPASRAMMPACFGQLSMNISTPNLSACPAFHAPRPPIERSEEHTSELQSLMRISYAVFCLKKKKRTYTKATKTKACRHCN